MSDTDVATRTDEAPVAATHRAIRIQEYALVFVIAALVVIGALISDRFLSYTNLLTILTAASVVGVLAVGMTFVIATGGIDLSVGSIVAAASIAGGIVFRNELFGEAGGSIAFILGAIVFALLLGLVNSLAITWGRVVPFIATLAMFTMARGLALRMSSQQPISLAQADTVRYLGIRGRIFDIPIAVLIFLAIVLIGWFVLNRTAFGRYVVATGGNPEAARIAGIRVQRIKFSVYLISAGCAGIASVLLSGRLGSASPVVGNLYELDAIAAVVIGGTSLSGGKATMVGTFLGVITFQLIFNLLNVLGLPAELQQIVKGLIILLAVIAQRQRNP